MALFTSGVHHLVQGFPDRRNKLRPEAVRAQHWNYAPRCIWAQLSLFFFFTSLCWNVVFKQSVSRSQVQEHYMLKSLVGKCSHQMGDLPAPVLWKAGNLGMIMAEAVLHSKDTTFSSPPL